MPAPSAPTLTLRLLAELIMSLPEIPLWKRRELCSAIRNFAKVCGLTPDDIIADPGAIRTLGAKAPWLLAGYTKGSWANIMWRLRCALEIGGVKVHRQRRNFKLNAEWEKLHLLHEPPGQLTAILQALKAQQRYQWVLLDLPHGYSPLARQFLEYCVRTVGLSDRA